MLSWQAGRWPVGSTISQRVLYAEELRGVATGLAAFREVAARTETALLDRQRLLLGEWAPAGPPRAPGSAGPQLDPQATSLAYRPMSHPSSGGAGRGRAGSAEEAQVPGAERVGGAEAAAWDLIGYAPGELGPEYCAGRAHAAEAAAGTSGGALLEPGLVHKANYRTLRHDAH